MRHSVIPMLGASAAHSPSCACGGLQPNGGGGTGEPVAVSNRNIGENNWIVEPDLGRAVAGVGAVETFEIVNVTSEDILPDVGLSKELFNVIFNSCLEGLKPGRTCVVRGEWLAEGAKDAMLDVAVTKQGKPSDTKKRISVPLQAPSGSDATTKRTVAPTPAPTARATSSYSVLQRLRRHPRNQGLQRLHRHPQARRQLLAHRLAR